MARRDAPAMARRGTARRGTARRGIPNHRFHPGADSRSGAECCVPAICWASLCCHSARALSRSAISVRSGSVISRSDRTIRLPLRAATDHNDHSGRHVRGRQASRREVSARRQSHAIPPGPDNRPDAAATQPVACPSSGDRVGDRAMPGPQIAPGRPDRRQDEDAYPLRRARIPHAGEIPPAASPVPPFQRARWDLCPKLTP